MIRDEIKNLILEIKGIYPNFKYEGTTTIDAWHKKLENVSYDEAICALEKYFEKGNEYPPSLIQFVKLLPQEQPITGWRWCYGKDEYGFEFVYQPNNPEKIYIEKECDELYRDKKGRPWAIV